MNIIFKIFPWVFGLVFTLIISCWISMGYLAVKSVDSIDQKGIKGLAEQVWCGKEIDCKLPEVLK